MTMLTRSALRWIDENRRRAALRNLLVHDDRTLEDVGLMRGDIVHALDLPIGTNAAAAAHRASRRSLNLDRCRGA